MVESDGHLRTVRLKYPAQMSRRGRRLQPLPVRREGLGLGLLQPGPDDEVGEGAVPHHHRLEGSLAGDDGPLHPAVDPDLLPGWAQHGNVELHEVPLGGQVLSEGEGVLL